MTDRHGNTMRFDYDTAGRLVRVLDTLGRPIIYHYDAPGHLAMVEDFAGRRIRFGYDARGDFVLVTSPAVMGTPNGNDFPQGKTTRYAYSSGMADPTLNHNLVAITAPNEVASGGPYYLRARYFHPLDGRFISRDPIGVWGDRANLGNGYSYVGNRPTSRTDPFGLLSQDYAPPNAPTAPTPGAVQGNAEGATITSIPFWLLDFYTGQSGRTGASDSVIIGGEVLDHIQQQQERSSTPVRAQR